MVPYNPSLSRRYNCHINVEVTTGVRAVEYIYKYIYKGEDRAMVLVGDALVPAPVNEIERYVDSRYICAQQAVWRMLAYPMHDHFPSIMRLAYHLPGEHQVLFDADANLEELLNDPASGRSMLTSFFEFCQRNPDITRNVTYADAPRALSYYKSGNKKGWHIRQRGGTLGRMYFAKPSQGERFYLRMLFNVVKSPKSFDDLKTFGREEPWETFKEACIARGMLADDQEWHLCFTEAAGFQTGSQYRQLYCTIICNHHEANARQLFNTHFVPLSDDVRRILERMRPGLEPSEQDIRDYCLLELEKGIRRIDSNRGLADFDLPEPSAGAQDRLRPGNALVNEERDYDMQQMRETVDCDLNESQRLVTERILESVRGESKVSFLQGPGGTGKTFVENGELSVGESEAGGKSSLGGGF